MRAEVVQSLYQVFSNNNNYHMLIWVAECNVKVRIANSVLLMYSQHLKYSDVVGGFERDNPYYFFRTNQQKADTKIYLSTQCSHTVHGCDWHIFLGGGAKTRKLNHILWLGRVGLFITSEGRHILGYKHLCLCTWQVRIQDLVKGGPNFWDRKLPM